MVEKILSVIWINTTYKWHTRGQAWSRRFYKWYESILHTSGIQEDRHGREGFISDMNQYYLRVAYKRTGMVENILLVIWINTTYKWHTRGQAWSRRFYQWYESILHTSGIQEDRHGREGFLSDMNQYYIQVAYRRTGMVEKVLSVIWINTTYKWHTRGQAWSRRFYQWYESILHTSGKQEDRHGRDDFISDMNQYYIQVAYKRTGMVEKILLVIWIKTTYKWHTRGQAWSRRFYKWYESILHTSGIQEDRHGREGFISDMNQYYIQVAYKRTGMVEKVLSVIWINTTYEWHTRGQAWSRIFY